MNSSNPNIYLIPRWAGNVHSDWYDWLELEIKNKYQIEIHRLEMPNWNQPDIVESLAFLENEIPEINKNTYFIAHSVGCQVVLRLLDKRLKLNTDLKIGGFLFIAGWFEVDKPWISLKPWMKTENIDLLLISQQTNFKKIIISDNDPFTTDYNRNKSLWSKYMDANISIYHNKLHFNQSEEPEVLNELEEMIIYSNKMNIGFF